MARGLHDCDGSEVAQQNTAAELIGLAVRLLTAAVLAREIRHDTRATVLERTRDGLCFQSRRAARESSEDNLRRRL
jgi:hypothetical protein